MDILGSEARETVVRPDDDVAAYRYETIPIKNEGSYQDDMISEAKTFGDVDDIVLPEGVDDDDAGDSVNYGYHPIIDFFGNFRFDAAA